MSFVMVDVEADGPIPGTEDYSMISFGAVLVEDQTKTFYGRLKPISPNYIPEALKVSGHTREETMGFDEPEIVMKQFDEWITANVKGRPMFVSDNNGFDWMFVCWYFHHFTGFNPFGFSSMNLGSLFKGAERTFFANFKYLRDTKHTHHPVDDAKGNCEAMVKILKKYNIKSGLKV